MENERLWGSEDADAEALDDVHLQGRRWGGQWYERSYGSSATFASYNVEKGDREGLRKCMPQEHLDFLQMCPWVHVEDHPLVGRCVFVHAGLEADCSDDCAAQVSRLRDRDARHPQPEQLFGRHGVLHTPPQLSRRGITVVSGHHGRLSLRQHRVIVDNCAGDEQNALAAVVFPEMLVVRHNGKLEAHDPSLVFPDFGRNKRGQSHALADETVGANSPAGTRPGSKGRVGLQSFTPAFRHPSCMSCMPQGDYSPLEE